VVPWIVPSILASDVRSRRGSPSPPRRAPPGLPCRNLVNRSGYVFYSRNPGFPGARGDGNHALLGVSQDKRFGHSAGPLNIQHGRVHQKTASSSAFSLRQPGARSAAGHLIPANEEPRAPIRSRHPDIGPLQTRARGFRCKPAAEASSGACCRQDGQVHAIPGSVPCSGWGRGEQSAGPTRFFTGTPGEIASTCSRYGRLLQGARQAHGRGAGEAGDGRCSTACTRHPGKSTRSRTVTYKGAEFGSLSRERVADLDRKGRVGRALRRSRQVLRKKYRGQNRECRM